MHQSEIVWNVGEKECTVVEMLYGDDHPVIYCKQNIVAKYNTFVYTVYLTCSLIYNFIFNRYPFFT